jgi:hypothetical protein
LYQDFKEYNENYTSAYVHENGWMFGVPLKHRKAFGYLYNRDITSEEDALQNYLENLKNYVGLKDIDVGKIKRLKLFQYYKRKIIKNRIITFGNKLYFFDPHSGLPLHFNLIMVGKIIEFITSDKNLIEIENEINDSYNKQISLLEDLMALNYAGKNKIDSDFWNIKKKESHEHLKNSEELYQWYKDTKLNPNCRKFFWTFGPNLMRKYINGYKVDLDELFKGK